MNNRLGEIPAWAMEDFFREVDTIKSDIDAVSKAAKEIGKINEQSMRATTTAEEQKLAFRCGG